MNQTLKVVSVFLMAILFIAVSTADTQARYYENQAEQPKPYIIKGLATIQFEDDIDLNTANAMQKSFGKVSFSMPSLDAILDANQVSSARKVFPIETERPKVNSGMADLTRYYEVKFPEDVDVMTVVNELSQNPNIRMAEPVWAMPLTATPNDPQWGNQWHMDPPDPDPHFYNAWDYESGADTIKFALIDSGILYNHQDLRPNIWVNPGEDLDGDGEVYDTDDFNGIDDDGNGYIDDVVGYDFFTFLSGGVWPGEDGGTPDNDPSDFDGHGTHVAGIAAAANNNGLDVTGAAGGWFGGHPAFKGVQIICCRVGATGADGNGYVNSNDCATAINYAVNMGAHVINASWGGSSTSAAAANNAVVAGVNFFHAAGNDNSNSPDNIDFVTGVLSVASTTSTDGKSSFSNWGSWVDVAAPGSNILSTYSFSYTPGTASIGGTSMASPMAAGVALLIRSQMPSLTKDQVDSIIIFNADFDALYNANPTFVGLLGSGRIDTEASLQDLANAKFTSDVTSGTAPLTVNFTDLSPNSPVGWDWSFGNGDSSTVQNPSYVYNDPGIYDVSLIVDEGNPLGNGEEHLKKYIWVTDDTLSLDSVDTQYNTEVVIQMHLTNSALVKEIQYPFSYANFFNATIDSFNVTGTRADYFESVQFNAFDAFNKRASILMKTNLSTGSNFLPPGDGAVLNLYFSIGSTDSSGIMTIDTTTFNGKAPLITTIYGDYFPASFTPGIINVGGCCVGIRGNIDSDPLDQINIADLVYFVDFSFGSPAGPAPINCY